MGLNAECHGYYIIREPSGYTLVNINARAKGQGERAKGQAGETKVEGKRTWRKYFKRWQTATGPNGPYTRKNVPSKSVYGFVELFCHHFELMYFRLMTLLSSV